MAFGAFEHGAGGAGLALSSPSGGPWVAGPVAAPVLRGLVPMPDRRGVGDPLENL